MTHRRLAPALLAALLIVPLAACSSGGGAESLPGMPGAATSDYAGADAAATTEDGSASVAGRSIIRTADISIEVDDPSAAAAEVAEIAERFGGRVESRSVQNSGDGFEAGAFLSLRVPSERLDEAFAAVGEVGRVFSQNQSASDVTADHVDLQARVDALEESVQRLTELMARADTTADLIEAEGALAQRQQELDGLRAQLKSLEGQVDEATISVSLSTKSAIPGGPANFWEGLVAGWESIAAAGAGALVLFGVLLPWLALLGIVALVVILIVRSARASRRRKAARAAAQTGAQAGEAQQQAAAEAVPEAPAEAAYPAPPHPQQTQSPHPPGQGGW